MRGRYMEVWTDALDAEHAAIERDRVERSYRGMLALTDQVLGGLERRNLAGQRALDDVMQRDLARILDELTPGARARFPRTVLVQEALDGIFAVQAELMGVLQRMLHWSRVLSTDARDDEDAAADEPRARRTA
jgi:hypothetical protein